MLRGRRRRKRGRRCGKEGRGWDGVFRLTPVRIEVVDAVDAPIKGGRRRHDDASAQTIAGWQQRRRREMMKEGRGDGQSKLLAAFISGGVMT